MFGSAGRDQYSECEGLVRDDVEYVLFSRSSRFRRKTLETVVIGRQVVKREERSGCCALFLMSFVTEVEGNLYKGSMRFSPRRVANQRV